MKKGIKALLLSTAGIAASMALACQCFGANLNGFSVKGSIAKEDTILNIDLPSDTLTIRPYAQDMVSSSNNPKAIYNSVADDDTLAPLSIKVSLAGYTLTKSVSGTVTFCSTQKEVTGYDGTAKKAYLAIEVGDSTADDPTQSDDFDSLFDNAPINVVAKTVSSADYDSSKTSSKYTAVTSKQTVTVAPGEYAPVRIAGAVGSMSNWVSSDALKVTPVFKVTAFMEN